MNSTLKIFIITFVSWLYWLYLGLNTEMIVAHDSIDYQNLGQFIADNGIVAFFKSGPHREPIYPLIIASAVKISGFLSLPMLKVLTFLQILILVLTQQLLIFILKKSKVHVNIIVCTLAYLMISPAINNSALSLYSEIATFPLILGIIIVTWRILLNTKNALKTAWIPSICLSLLFLLLTLTKAIAEVIFPIYLLLIVLLLLLHSQSRSKSQARYMIIIITICSLTYFPLVHAYKSLNKTHNGQYVITDRGPWALYGNTARRMKVLDTRMVLVALASTPGESVCKRFFKEAECLYFHYQTSDTFGFTRLKELTAQNLSHKEINKTLVSESLKLALSNPAQFALFSSIEGIKMLFWESTQIGFVAYPTWLTKFYNSFIVRNGMRLDLFLCTLLGLWGGIYRLRRNQDNNLELTILCFIISFIAVHSLFYILTRYALPIAPLYFILIALTLDTLLCRKDLLKSQT